ncbi:adenosine 5'-monophosphoramidase HINT3-like [Pectinophora gossypiella]|uniref:adenosine 5'-monophosphoramidase HINT3-like n=1 Tax=Pectinophora gossypiella TaxID=13191 RepID=UPI00214E7DD7|nr:adenosine 5'-monophosphoramidase HINT3-like [Pectinophora gossypiella]
MRFYSKIIFTSIVITLITVLVTEMAVERSSCIFCNIVNKLENTEILFEDDEVCVFRDIKPATRFHTLTIPKRHIDDVKALNKDDKELVAKMLAVSKDLLSKNNLSVADARFGYHWPPFRSVRHLHLHTIAPEAEMGYIGRLLFMKNSYWFVSPEYIEKMLS